MKISSLKIMSVASLLFSMTALYAQDTTVVNMGLVSRAKISMSEAVEQISGIELTKAPTILLSEALMGRLPGMMTWQSSSSLNGDSSISKYIRGISTMNNGSVLVVVDGIVMKNYNIDYITAEEIEDVVLLKDAAATTLYGCEASNGVIVINTKKGFSGPLKISANIDYSMQQVSKKPQRITSAQYASLRNEAWRNDGSSGVAPFSDSELGLISSGSSPLYPDNDWYGLYTRDIASLVRAGINVSGGTRKVSYFSNVNFYSQGSLFRAYKSQEQYNASPRNFGFNFRVKLDFEVAKNLNAFVNIAGNVNKETYAGTGYTNSSIYALLFCDPSTMIGPVNGNGQIMTTNLSGTPVYGILNSSGYSTKIQMNLVTNIGVKYDFAKVLEGLSIQGGLVFQNQASRNQHNIQDFERYFYDYPSAQYLKYGSSLNTELSASVSGTFEDRIDYIARVDYSRKFGRHNVSAMIFSDYSTELPGTWSNDYPAVGMNYNRHNTGLMASYCYDDRYCAQLSFGYSGSDAFARGKRYVFLPSASAAWTLSKEPFMQSARNVMSFAKLSASYGFMANDRVAPSSQLRFFYMDYITSGGSVRLLGNPDLEPEITKRWNVGLDLEFLGSIGLDVDVFGDRVDNMFISQSGLLPEYQGTALDAIARSNGGRMKNGGYEIALSYDKTFGGDWTVGAKVAWSGTRDLVIESGELVKPSGEGGYAYAYNTNGYPIGQSFGYLIDRSNGSGYISTTEELSKYAAMYAEGGLGTPRLGDFIYKDLNNDGIISVKDKAPIGKGSVPSNQLIVNLNLRWKCIEFSALLHGLFGITGGMDYMTERNYNGVFNDLHLAAWTPERAASGAEIKYPALTYSASSPSNNSNDFNIVDRSFLKLRNVSLYYIFPEVVNRALKASDMRIGLNVQNLACWDFLATKVMDPEIGSMTSLQPFRTWNISLKLNF
ncbi:MAG: SusC/RagA family TonB-linked outer membrane protein [Bacteroidales bacterium]|nr:SusC/RagA family TonB-linked outer membrane protein [Bacteroidales bacterium]